MEFLVIGILLACPLGITVLIATGRIAHHSAWRALYVTVIGLALIALTYMYIGAVGGNESMREFVNMLWSWNLLSGGMQYFPMPTSYDSLDRHLLLYWVWLCPPLLIASIVLGFLEYLDSRSGIEIAERVRKLIWK